MHQSLDVTRQDSSVFFTFPLRYVGDGQIGSCVLDTTAVTIVSVSRYVNCI